MALSVVKPMLFSHLTPLLLLFSSFCSSVALAQEPLPTLYQLISSQPETFLTFRTAVDLAGLDSLLQNEAENANANVTLVVPTNDAFGSVDGKYLDTPWKDYLKAFLEFHVLKGAHFTPSLTKNATFATVFSPYQVMVTEGDPITLSGDAMLIDGNIEAAGNSVLHVVNSVMEPPFMTMNLLEHLVPNANTTTLSSATRFYELLMQLLMTDQVPLDEGEGPYTLLVPTNEAMDALPIDQISEEDLTKIVLSHILPSIVLTYDLTEGQAKIATPLLGDMLNFTATGVSNAQWIVSESNLLASNGVLHSIDTVLIPSDIELPEFVVAEEEDTTTEAPTISDNNITTNEDTENTFQTLVPGNEFELLPEEEEPLPSSMLDFLLSAEENTYEDLIAAAVLTDLDNALTAVSLHYQTQMTLFAPTNSAFAAVPIKFFEIPWRLHLAALVAYHMVAGAIHSNDFSENDMLTTVYGETLRVTGLDPAQLNDLVTVTSPDQKTANGVVHAIDQLLLPSFMTSTLMSTLDTNPDTSALASQIMPLQYTNSIVSQFDHSNAELTLFIPLNSAFHKLVSHQDLQDSVEYHVVRGIVTSNELIHGATFTTVQGKNVTIHLSSDQQLMINNETKILELDVLCNNGIIHYIDTVLVPDTAEEMTQEQEETWMEESNNPFDIPFIAPSIIPTATPSNVPSDLPSSVPSDVPSDTPSNGPSEAPSMPFPTNLTASNANATNHTTLSALNVTKSGRSGGCSDLLPPSYAAVCCPLENPAFASFCEDLYNQYGL